MIYRYDRSILTPCLFEYIYFSRPDSVVEKINVTQARIKIGTLLGKKIHTNRWNEDGTKRKELFDWEKEPLEPNDQWEKWMKIGLLVIISYFICVLIPQVIFKIWL